MNMFFSDWFICSVHYDLKGWASYFAALMIVPREKVSPYFQFVLLLMNLWVSNLMTMNMRWEHCFEVFVLRIPLQILLRCLLPSFFDFFTANLSWVIWQSPLNILLEILQSQVIEKYLTEAWWNILRNSPLISSLGRERRDFICLLSVVFCFLWSLSRELRLLYH